MAPQPDRRAQLLALVQPIAGKSPTGMDLRESTKINSYAQLQGVIKDDRRYQDKAGQEGAPANWADVKQRAWHILESESKDLEVAVWLVRALVKTGGIDGLRDGLELLCGLHGQFAESLFPSDADMRRSRLEWLDQQLEQDLRETPLPSATDREQVRQVASGLSEALAAVTQTVTELKPRYAEDPPTFGRIRRILELLRGGLGESGPAQDAGSVPDGSSAAGTAGPSGGPRNRAEALRMLEQVAAYFDASEPLSPVPHLLRRAQRWARGSLQQWLTEMVDKNDQLESIYKTLDMTKPAAKE